jgi:hypothetical protein
MVLACVVQAFRDAQVWSALVALRYAWHIAGIVAA